MLHSLASGLQLSGVILAIRLFHDSATTGLFSWGNQVASQAILLLVTNLRGIFFPTLMKLNADPTRQRAAILRTAKFLTFATVCLCLLQAALTPYLIPVIFGDRWTPAVPVVIWLSVGLSTSHLDLLVTALLAAHERNRLLALLAVAQTVVIVGAVLTTASLAGGNATAAVLGLATAATNILIFVTVFRLSSARLVSPARPVLSSSNW
jgi:PST family polysaccharide transporter